jgi:hypothetical protein
MPGAAHERAAALEAAAALLALAMSESHEPVDVLGSALERMAKVLSRCARAIERQRALGLQRPGGHPESPLGELEDCRQALEREIAVCIESLQFHDRLMQRLAHVGGYLAGLNDTPPAVGDLHRLELSEGTIELF